MKKSEKPLILISNDDGYQAKGINSLVDMLRDMADLVVCAPDGPRSGQALAFSAHTPLTLRLQHREPGLEVWVSNGTPVDCLKLALNQFFADRRPDMVVAGINHGENGTVNVHYSGTMGIALEGCMKYIPSVAFSLCDFRADADFSPMRPVVRRVVERVLREGLPLGVCLNVTCPAIPSYRGIRLCRMAKGTWFNECVKEHHPRGYDYFWMVGEYKNDEPEAEDTDNWAVTHGYVAITPTRTDVTDYDYLKRFGATFE